MELIVPLDVKGGPAVLLTLKAQVVVPDIVMSATSLDFGTVPFQHCKVGRAGWAAAGQGGVLGGAGRGDGGCVCVCVWGGGG